MTKTAPSPRIAFALALAVLVVMVPSALAGKGGGSHNSGSYSITITPAGPYSFGQQVYVTTDAPNQDPDGPWIAMSCYQNGVLVGNATHAGFPGGWYYQWPFQFGPTPSWGGGAADCKFTVGYQYTHKGVVVAETWVHVDG
jgi:hypothetical protein